MLWLTLEEDRLIIRGTIIDLLSAEALCFTERMSSILKEKLKVDLHWQTFLQCKT